MAELNLWLYLQVLVLTVNLARSGNRSNLYAAAFWFSEHQPGPTTTTTAPLLTSSPPVGAPVVRGAALAATADQISQEQNESNDCLERGKLLPEHPSPQDLYEAYSEIQQDYQRKAFSADQQSNWQVLNDKHNVKVSLLTHPNDPTCPYVKMEGRIPVPVEECWEWLRVDDWDRTMKVMDPFYEGSEIHGDYTYRLPANNGNKIVRMLLCRKRTTRILAFGPRDLVFLSVAQEQPTADDGSWVSGTVSVRTARLPRQAGYTRAFQDSIAFYKPVDDNTQTCVRGLVFDFVVVVAMCDVVAVGSLCIVPR